MKSRLNKTTQVVRQAMKDVSKNVRDPKCVRDGLIEKNKYIVGIDPFDMINPDMVETESAKRYYKILTENSEYGEKDKILPGNTCPYCVSIELASIMYPTAYIEVYLTEEEINKLREYGK